MVLKDHFDRKIDNKDVNLYILENNFGSKIDICNYGGIVISMLFPDKYGKLIDVILGYSTLEGYINGCPYFGAIIGRCANRIDKGKFSIDKKKYQLSVNMNDVHLHGGFKSFSHVVWEMKNVKKNSIELQYISKDGEEGYPGNLTTNVIYKLTEDNEFVVEIYAVTDIPTIVNITTHPFFNLEGHDFGNIYEHKLKLNADYYLHVTDNFIPQGNFSEVKNTPFDFTNFKTIGKDINKNHTQLIKGKGYDHNFVLKKNNKSIDLAAVVIAPNSGIQMEIFTNQPGIQFYSGNWIDGSDIGKSSINYPYRAAFCLETQHFPDSINQPSFPSIILYPGEKYYHKTIHKFSTIDL